MVLLVGLRHGTAAAFLGVDDDLRYLTQRLRETWPDVEIIVRADAGFGVPVMYEVCEELEQAYTFGIGMNSVLQRKCDDLLDKATTQYNETQEKQRLFMETEYHAGTWTKSRRVVIKCEAHQGGLNRRGVVTNRTDCQDGPQPIYDDYVQRGESENRNKELKCELCADRLSDHRFMANYFRLYLHASSLNLLIRLRQETEKGITPEKVGLPSEVLEKTATPSQKKLYFNRRRRADPLGEGFACTWRTMFIKVACEVSVSARRVLVKLSSHWPHLSEFQRVSQSIQALDFSSG